MTSTYTKPNRRVVTAEQRVAVAYPPKESVSRKPTKLTHTKSGTSYQRTFSTQPSDAFDEEPLDDFQDDVWAMGNASSVAREQSVRPRPSMEPEKDLKTRRKERAAKLKERRKAAKASKKAEVRAAKGPRTFRSIMTVVVSLAVVCVSVFWLYPVSKEYYTNLRENERLQAELDAVNHRNQTIENTINNLQTDEGVEDQARSEFGWVKNGDNAVNVTNVGDITSPTELPSQVDSKDVKAPDNWITHILDGVFGVE